MLSGNGRHRRPRQAPALLVAAGVTGSAIAIPLLGASGASAADGTVWDKVAECETGGSWSANEGGGEYGGLSLTQEDWETHGGLDYASRPDLASRNQQISVAQKLLADQGVGAWGTCGLTSGLSKESGSVDLDTGVADDSSDSSITSGLSDLSRGSSGSSNSSGSSSDSGDTSTDPSADSSSDTANTPSSSPSSPSSSSSSTPDSPSKSDAAAGSDASGSQADDSSPSGTPEAGGSDNSEQSAGSWSLVDTGAVDAAAGSGRHRGGTADESATEGAPAASSGRHAASTLGGTAGTYTVQAGDSLASIADSLDLDGGWRALYAENKDLIGADPSNISPGQTLATGVE
ncbi:LysM peptidoglycan-binding domain-containing protein [Streptomyces aurantiogriseus]|uniref:Peptidoglycan-binding protein LysM n=1 Tax=Streptomyces aurantiogriseus TaxID=66870 RepID=A0A918C3W8_9ACTN|nr:transglycosylase family protein [Streptomyces aurantiogriseus]GGR04502.1 peptidoglycan-binding protein LysM [Streptomyces aurantiogriseus]